MVQGPSVTPRCPSSAAIAGHVALPFRNRLISFRYGQSWLWNGFGCDVGFMVKTSCRHAPGGVMSAVGLLAAGKKRRKDPAPKGDSQCPTAYSRFSTLGSTTVPSGRRTTKNICRIGPLVVSEKETSQNGTGCVRNSCVSSAPICA